MGISDYTNKLGSLLHLLPNQWLVSNLKGRVIFPFYHTVGNHSMPHIKHLYAVKSEAQFTNDLDYYGKHFNFLELNEISKPNNSKPNIHLSFDDGFRECYDIIRPILLSKGIPATFFINTGFVQNEELMYRCKASLIYDALLESPSQVFRLEVKDLKVQLSGNESSKRLLFGINYEERYLLDFIIDRLNIPIKSWMQTYQPYMNENQIRELVNDGFTIGAHSHDHPVFKELRAEEQKEQIFKSVNLIHKICGVEHCPFSFPFHDLGVDSSVWDFIQSSLEINYTFGVSGIKESKHNNHFHRVAMEDCQLTVDQRISSAYLAQSIRKLLGK